MEYSHEQIIVASLHYFVVNEMLHPLSPPEANGQIAVKILVATLFKPFLTDFKSIARYGITCFHNFAFAHKKDQGQDQGRKFYELPHTSMQKSKSNSRRMARKSILLRYSYRMNFYRAKPGIRPA